ncbi:DUF748 domain-containing protein [Thermaurantiacus sp.]
MASLARRWWILAPAALLLLLGLFWVAQAMLPALVRSQAQAWTREKLGLELAIGAVRVDPLRLALELEDLALPAGAPMVSTRKARVDLSWRSLLSSSLRLDEVRVEAPRIDAELDSGGRLNLARLVPPDDGEPTPSVLIADLQVQGGQISFRDGRQQAAPELRVFPLEFALSDLHTTQDAGGRFRLKGTTPAGEALGWTGSLILEPLASTGAIVVKGLDAGRAGLFLGTRLPAKIRGGRVDLTLPYRIAFTGGRLEADLMQPKAELRDLDLLARPDMLNAAVKVASVRIDAGHLRLAQQPREGLDWRLDVPAASAVGLLVEGLGPAEGERVQIGAVRLADVRSSARGEISGGRLRVEGLNLDVVREPGGAIRLLRMLPAAVPAGDGPPVAIAQIEFADARVRFDERSTARPGRYRLEPVSARVTGFRSDGTKPLALEASGGLNGRPWRLAGTISADGSRADLAVRLTALPLAAALPYLPDFPALELMSGTLGIDGRLRYAVARGQPEIGFAGALDVDGFRLRELVRNSDLLRFAHLRMSGIGYDGRSLTVAEARLVRPVGQVALLSDGQLNYGFLLDEETTMVDAQARLAARQAPKKRLTRAERREARARAEAEKQARIEARARARPAAEPDLPLTIKRLVIENGTFVFSDFLVEPDFRAEVQAVHGTVSGLSNRPHQVAQIDLRGHVVDRFSPVTISGRMNLFDYAAATDMRLAFRNIDLPVFNPYSGTYAGFAIAKGKLSAELDYRVVNAALAANHRIVIDQLEWGEATESQQKVGLPVRLATSILKDRHGVISIELPVSGTVDDPAFRLMPLIWKALGQFLGKLVTAPFRALGGLFAEREDAHLLAFAPGSAAIPAGGEETLAALGKALAERPLLRLDIPASPGLESDARALAAQALEAALMAGGRKAEAGMAFAHLSIERQYDRMRELYGKRMPGKPAFAQAEQGDKDARRLARIKQMQSELLPLFRPDAEALRALGEARAKAVRDVVLAQPNVDPSRVFLDRNDRFTAEGDKVRMELRLR